MLKKDVFNHYSKKTTNVQWFIADMCGITQASVSRWGRIIPERHAMFLQKATRGRLRYDPDLYKRRRLGISNRRCKR